MKVGDRVVATYPDESHGVVGVIIDGPIFRNGKAVFKFRHRENDNWIPADWLKPSMIIVDT